MRHRLALTAKLQQSTFRLFVCAWLGVFTTDAILTAAKTGELELHVIDATTHEPIPARLRMTNSQGRPPSMRNVVRQGLDITFEGPLTMNLKPGRYAFTLDRGLHYRQRSGHLDVDRDGFDVHTLALPRFADLRQEGWYGGDMFVDRPLKDLRLLAAAEELDVVVAPTWRAGLPLSESQLNLDRNIRELDHPSLADCSGGLIETAAGTLVASHLSEPVDLASLSTNLFDSASLVRHDRNAHFALLDVNAWDMPTLAAHNLVDSIAILNTTQRLLGDEPKPKYQRPSPQPRHGLVGGIGGYSMETYFRLLNCGLRIPPSACSGSGECDNAPGYNRVYVACGADFSAETWYRNLQRGRVFISNGPLLRVRINDELPGHTFEASAGGEVTLDIACQLATQLHVDYLEIIKNGSVVDSVRLKEWAAKGGELPLVKFTESGWIAIRVLAESDQGYRCAMTGPFYVSIGAKRRISKSAAQYFQEWVLDRARQIRSQPSTPEELRTQLAPHRVAHDYWQQLVAESNAP